MLIIVGGTSGSSALGDVTSGASSLVSEASSGELYAVFLSGCFRC